MPADQGNFQPQQPIIIWMSGRFYFSPRSTAEMTKSIIITGGSRGIGAATAVLAGQRGWSVAINYVGNAEAATAIVDAVESAGGKAFALQGDVTQEADVVALFDATAKAFGRIDGVVNNAGIVGPTAALADMDIGRLRRIIDVNLLGALLVAREAARRLAKGKGGNGGVIVNLSSAAAKLGAPNVYVDYAAAKGAIESLTTGLSKELGSEGIRVAAVRPGLIETDIHASGGEPDRAVRLGATAPLGRAGTPEEVAHAIIWLLSDQASYVTGAILDVTGGR
jgi:NAD(P)-dependent dehydrogenase (short-subunit alcohol dehydrogenase family)